VEYEEEIHGSERNQAEGKEGGKKYRGGRKEISEREEISRRGKIPNDPAAARKRSKTIDCSLREKNHEKKRKRKDKKEKGSK
jgi:hypothetical protein